MMHVLHDLLMNRRFVIVMSVVWIACAWMSRRETKIPTAFGIVVHGILCLSPILSISAYGFAPDVFQILWNIACMVVHAVLYFTAYKNRRRS